MTKPSIVIIFILLITSHLSNAQCDFTNPDEGLNIDNPVFLCGDLLDGYSGRLPLTDSPGDQPAVLCSEGGIPDNILWFSFVPTSFNVSFSISYTNCTVEPLGDHLQAGIYADTDFSEEVACNSFPMSSPLSLNATGLNPGQMYYLFVDGAAGSVCDFSIDVISGVSNGLTTFDFDDDDNNITATDDDLVNIQLNQNACSGTDSLYTYVAPLCEMRQGASIPFQGLDEYGLLCYEWTISPAGGGSIVGDPNGRSIEVDWQSPGDYTVSVNINAHPNLLACSSDICTDINDIEVTVTSSSDITLPPIFFCPDQPVLFCGEMISSDTIVACISDFSTCQNEIQEFITLPYDTINYGTQVLCGSECFELFGFEYCMEGDYVIPDPMDCNIRHSFTIESFRVDINLPASMELDCDVESLAIGAEYSTNYTGTIITRWEEGGNTIQNGDTLFMNRPGLFTFVVEFPDLLFDCSGIASLEILENVNAPEIDLNVPVLNCDFPVGIVSFISSDPLDSISWYNSSGFQSVDTQLLVNTGGVFNLFTKGENGCVSDTSFTILQDFDAPDITVSYDNLDCIIENTTATFTSNRIIRSQIWTDPLSNISSNIDLFISDPGDFQLVATADNGCETTVPFTIIQDIIQPMADAGDDQVWQCNTESVQLLGQTDNIDHEVLWDFINEGNILGSPGQLGIEVGRPGSYRLNVTNMENGCGASDTVLVVNNEDVPEVLEATPMDPSCYGESDGFIQILGVTGGTAPYTYFLNGSQVNEGDLISDLAAGSYLLQVFDAFECELSNEYILMESSELILNVPTSLELGFNENLTLEAFHNLTEGELSGIFWYDMNGNLIGSGDTLDIQGFEDTEITVELVDINGCSINQVVEIRVNIDLPVYTPNVFSPNEDGINDRFTIYARDYPGYVESLSVFNRWGELMYNVRDLQFNDEENGWDGTYKGQSLDSAVFTFTAVIKLLDGSDKIVSGDITLMK